MNVRDKGTIHGSNQCALCLEKTGEASPVQRRLWQGQARVAGAKQGRGQELCRRRGRLLAGTAGLLLREQRLLVEEVAGGGPGRHWRWAHSRVAPRGTRELRGMVGPKEENGFGWQLDEERRSRVPKDFE